MSRDCGDIRTVEDLCKDSIERILKAHFKSNDVSVSDVGAFADIIGNNEHFGSDLQRATIKFRRGDETEEQEVHFVLKLPPTTFVRHFTKLLKLYQFEVEWYMQ